MKIESYSGGIILTNEDLQHHGILGQKWGVRRYQNEDGTLTEEGKRRYYVQDSTIKSTYNLNKKGREFNRKNEESYNRYKRNVYGFLNRVEKNEYENRKNNYLKALKNRNDFYETERNKFLNNEGEYKKKMPNQAAVISEDKYYSSDVSKEFNKAYLELEKIITEAAKEHPLYNKSYSKLDEYSFDEFPAVVKKIEYGKNIAKDLIRELEVDNNTFVKRFR